MRWFLANGSTVKFSGDIDKLIGADLKVRPLVVETDRHAEELSELTGDRWVIGDRFYQAYTEEGLITSRWQEY